MTVFFISVANYLYHLADDLEGTPIFTLDGPPDDGAAMGEGRGATGAKRRRRRRTRQMS